MERNNASEAQSQRTNIHINRYSTMCGIIPSHAPHYTISITDKREGEKRKPSEREEGRAEAARKSQQEKLVVAH